MAKTRTYYYRLGEHVGFLSLVARDGQWCGDGTACDRTYYPCIRRELSPATVKATDFPNGVRLSAGPVGLARDLVKAWRLYRPLLASSDVDFRSGRGGNAVRGPRGGFLYFQPGFWLDWPVTETWPTLVIESASGRLVVEIPLAQLPCANLGRVHCVPQNSSISRLPTDALIVVAVGRWAKVYAPVIIDRRVDSWRQVGWARCVRDKDNVWLYTQPGETPAQLQTRASVYLLSGGRLGRDSDFGGQHDDARTSANP